MKRALLLLALAPAVLLAQTPRDAAGPPLTIGQGVIAGTVVSDDASATPVRRAVVIVSMTDQRGDRRTVTDDQGRFALGDLPPGHYTLSATKAGWITSYYGSAHPGRPAFGGATVALTASQKITSLSLKMLRGAVIAGVVSDSSGRPEMNVDVEIATLRMQDGQRQLSTQNLSGPAGSSFTTTDDRGAFRLFGLPPGEYVVIAEPGFLGNFGNGEVLQLTQDNLAAARRSLATGTSASATGGVSNTTPASTPAPRPPTVGAANVYYPGTVDLAAATTIRLGPGEERAGVDFTVQLVPTARVEGVVMGPDGQPSTNANVQLLRASSGVSGFFSNSSTRTGADGRFQLVGVAPGPYQLIARAVDAAAGPPGGRGGGGAGGVSAMSTDGGMVIFNGNPRAMALWAADDISVAGQDVSGVSLTLQRGATVSGHVVFTGTSLPQPQDLSGLRLTLMPASDWQRQSFGSIGSQADNSGAFQFVNVPPGRYRLNAILGPAGRRGGPPAAAAISGWALKSALAGDVDAVDQAIDVTLGGPPPDLVVTFADKQGEIDGAVRNAAGQPVTDYRIVVFSADKTVWGTAGRRMRAPVQTEPDGTFRIEGLPAGKYFLAAVTDMDQDDLNNLPFLEDLAAHAIPITLADGEKRVQEIKISR